VSLNSSLNIFSPLLPISYRKHTHTHRKSVHIRNLYTYIQYGTVPFMNKSFISFITSRNMCSISDYTTGPISCWINTCLPKVNLTDCYIITANTQNQFIGHGNQGVYGSINLLETVTEMEGKLEILIIKHNTLWPLQYLWWCLGLFFT